MVDIDNMNIKQYFKQLSINFKERKRLFGSSFASVHASAGIPIDHNLKRNVFHVKGYHWQCFGR